MVFNTLTLTGAIYENVTVMERAQDITIGTIPALWTSDIILNCDFTTIYGGNPAGYDASNIAYVLVKRQKQGDTEWVTLAKIVVNQDPEKLSFEHHDYFAAHGVKYSYALVDVDLSGNESTYEIQDITSCFNKVFIVDGSISYDLTNATNYNSFQRNQQTGIYETFGRQHPIVVMNGKLDYYSMTTNAYLIKDNTTNNFDYIQQKEYIENFTKFLNNKKSKILKDYNGNIWLISINGSPAIEPIAELGNSIAKVSFNWVEIGNANKEDDLKNARIIPVKPIYSQIT